MADDLGAQPPSSSSGSASDMASVDLTAVEKAVPEVHKQIASIECKGQQLRVKMMEIIDDFQKTHGVGSADESRGFVELDDLTLQQQKPPDTIRTDLDVPGARVFTLTDLLTPQECKNLKDRVSSCGFKSLDEQFPANYRQNDRVLVISTSLAESLWERLSPMLQREDALRVRPVGFGNQGTWRPCRLNECFKFSRYQSGGTFKPHMDGPWVPRPNESSVYTVVIYLNDDFDGGGTRFFQDVTVNNLKDATGSTVSEQNVAWHQKPKMGSAVVFNHDVVHEGVAVAPGGTKYIVRTEIMFKRIDSHMIPAKDREAYFTDPNYLKMVTLYTKSVLLEDVGDVAGYTDAYLGAIALQTKAQSSIPSASELTQVQYPLASLPFVLLREIMLFLSASDVAQLLTVCKAWYDTLLDGKLWLAMYARRWPAIAKAERFARNKRPSHFLRIPILKQRQYYMTEAMFIVVVKRRTTPEIATFLEASALYRACYLAFENLVGSRQPPKDEYRKRVQRMYNYKGVSAWKPSYRPFANELYEWFVSMKSKAVYKEPRKHWQPEYDYKPRLATLNQSCLGQALRQIKGRGPCSSCNKVVDNLTLCNKCPGLPFWLCSERCSNSHCLFDKHISFPKNNWISDHSSKETTAARYKMWLEDNIYTRPDTPVADEKVQMVDKRHWTSLFGNTALTDTAVKRTMDPSLKDWYTAYRTRHDSSRTTRGFIIDLGATTCKIGRIFGSEEKTAVSERARRHLTRSDSQLCLRYYSVPNKIAKVPHVYRVHYRTERGFRHTIGRYATDDMARVKGSVLLDVIEPKRHMPSVHLLDRFLAEAFSAFPHPSHYPTMLVVCEPFHEWTESERTTVMNLCFSYMASLSINIVNSSVAVSYYHNQPNCLVVSSGSTTSTVSGIIKHRPVSVPVRVLHTLDCQELALAVRQTYQEISETTGTQLSWVLLSGGSFDKKRTEAFLGELQKLSVGWAFDVKQPPRKASSLLRWPFLCV